MKFSGSCEALLHVSIQPRTGIDLIIDNDSHLVYTVR